MFAAFNTVCKAISLVWTRGTFVRQRAYARFLHMDPSIVSILDGKDWWEAFDYPEYIRNQHFGVHLNDFPDVIHDTDAEDRPIVRRSRSSRAASGKSYVDNIAGKFEVYLMVDKCFKPEDFRVRVSGRFIVIHGKHEEREDVEGFASREFTRKYMLPNACDRKTASASLTYYDGLYPSTLTITVKTRPPIPKPADTVIPIVVESRLPSSEEPSPPKQETV